MAIHRRRVSWSKSWWLHWLILSFKQLHVRTWESPTETSLEQSISGLDPQLWPWSSKSRSTRQSATTSASYRRCRLTTSVHNAAEWMSEWVEFNVPLDMIAGHFVDELPGNRLQWYWQLNNNQMLYIIEDNTVCVSVSLLTVCVCPKSRVGFNVPPNTL